MSVKIVFTKFFVLASLMTSPLLASKGESISIQIAVESNADRLAAWVLENQYKIKSLAIFNVQVSHDLDKSNADFFEARFLETLRKDPSLKIVSCRECRSPQIRVAGDQLVIERGGPEKETIQKLAQKYGVQSFIEVYLRKTSTSIVLSAKVFDGNGLEIIDGITLSGAHYEVNDSAFNLIFNIGSGIGVGGDDDEPPTPFLGEISFVETFDSSHKFGFSVGGGSVNRRYLAYVAPSMFWKTGQKTNFNKIWGVGVGVGATDDAWGVLLKGSFDMFYGNLFGGGFNLKVLAPLQKEQNAQDLLNATIGFHVTFKLGV